MTRQTVFALNIMPFVVALLLVMGAPLAEQRLFPVVKDFVVTSLQRQPEAVVVSGYMRKVRDCQFVGIQAVAATGDAEFDVPLQFIDGTDRNATRPQGTQSWGPWRVTVPAIKADSLRLTATHRCHPLWATDTHLALIPLREYQ